MDLQSLDVSVLSYIYVKNKLKYLKLVHTEGEVFYLQIDDCEIDLEPNEDKKVKLKEVSSKNASLPVSIKQGNFQCVSKVVDGVLFELNTGIYVVYRDKHMKIKEDYYEGNIKPGVIPYPLIIYYDDLKLNILINRVKKANLCLFQTHKQNYNKMRMMLEKNYSRMCCYFDTYFKNISIALRRTEKDISKLKMIRDREDSDYIRYNMKIRDDITREMIDYGKLIDFNNKINDLFAGVSNANDTLVNSCSNLGQFHYHKIE